MNKIFDQHLHVTTNIESKEFCFDWVLENFSQLRQKLTVIKSPPIIYQDKEWLMCGKFTDSFGGVVAGLKKGHKIDKNICIGL